MKRVLLAGAAAFAVTACATAMAKDDADHADADGKNADTQSIRVLVDDDSRRERLVVATGDGAMIELDGDSIVIDGKSVFHGGEFAFDFDFDHLDDDISAVIDGAFAQLHDLHGEKGFTVWSDGWDVAELHDDHNVFLLRSHERGLSRELERLRSRLDRLELSLKARESLADDSDDDAEDRAEALESARAALERSRERLDELGEKLAELDEIEREQERAQREVRRKRMTELRASRGLLGGLSGSRTSVLELSGESSIEVDGETITVEPGETRTMTTDDGAEVTIERDDDGESISITIERDE